MAYFVKISIKGSNPIWKEMEDYNYRQLENADNNKWIEVPDWLFYMWFEEKRNSKNAVYHAFKGKGMGSMIRFMRELLACLKKTHGTY